MHRILVVDDDAELAGRLLQALRAKGYEVELASDGATALAIFLEVLPDLLVLDLVMPGLDGFAVLEQVRKNWTVPILAVAARHGPSVRMRALDEGADDCLTKPLDVNELLARIGALLRRTAYTPPDEHAYIKQFGDLRFDLRKGLVTRKGSRLHLSPTEYGLLLEFITHPDEVLTHETLLARVWGPDRPHSPSYLHEYVKRLRRKIEDDPANPRYIINERAVGYRFCSVPSK